MSSRRRSNMARVTGGLRISVAVPSPPLRRRGCADSAIGAVRAPPRAMPRRMLTSSALSCARLSSWFRRGSSFFGAAGSRKPISTSAPLPVLEQALHLRARSARVAFGRARPHAETAQRLPPLVGDQLHRLRQVERAVGRIGRNAQAGVAAVDVVVAHAEALRAEHEADAVAAGRASSRTARAARGWAGRSRAASSPSRRRG